jgi:AraC-like DNA-binding protein
MPEETIPLASHAGLETEDLDEAREWVGRALRPHRLRLLGKGTGVHVVHHMAELGATSLHYIDYGADVDITVDPRLRPGADSARRTGGHHGRRPGGGGHARAGGRDNTSGCARDALPGSEPTSDGADRPADGRVTPGADARRPTAHPDPLRPRHGPVVGRKQLLASPRGHRGQRPRQRRTDQPVAAGRCLTRARRCRRSAHSPAALVLRTGPRKWRHHTAPRPEEGRNADREHCSEPLTTADIAEAVGVSVRSLQEAFQHHLGINPMAYLRAARMRRIHADLLAGGEGISVTEVALRWGVTHAGRFAQEYRRMFGQAPSQTLRQAR